VVEREINLEELRGKMKPEIGFVRLEEKLFSREKVKREFGVSRLAEVDRVRVRCE
jgi:hypothetical protein